MFLKRSLLISLLCSLCVTQISANPINRKNAGIHATNGSRSIAAGDWNGARKHWAQAVVNGELGKIPDNNQAIFYYELSLIHI